MLNNCKFAVYEFNCIKDDRSERKRMIVLKCRKAIKEFTGLEVFAGPYGRQRIIKECSGQDAYYIVQFLNYIFKDSYFLYHIENLCEVTQQMVVDFFDYYREKEIFAEHCVGAQSLRKCVAAVTNFMANCIQNIGEDKCALHFDELLEQQYVKDQNGKERLSYVPLYQEKPIQAATIKIMRDITNPIYQILLDTAYECDPMIAFAMVVQRTAGLRPGEVMNLRQDCSKVAPGKSIRIYQEGTRVSKIELDLQRELPMRSDGKAVGGIKKERMAKVYPKCIPEFVRAYERHKTLLLYSGTEEYYAPLFASRGGKAMTYDTYRHRFQMVVKEAVPRLLESGDHQLAAYGTLLMQGKNIAPHILRHLFTVELVNDGCSLPELQEYRGDSSPVSSLVYLQNKSEIRRRIEQTHGDVIGALGGLGT